MRNLGETIRRGQTLAVIESHVAVMMKGEVEASHARLALFVLPTLYDRYGGRPRNSAAVQAMAG